MYREPARIASWAEFEGTNVKINRFLKVFDASIVFKNSVKGFPKNLE